MVKRRRRSKIYPLLNLNCQWVQGIAYPYTIRVPMNNGRVIPYHVEFFQVAPHIIPKDYEEQEGIVVGYKYTARDGNHGQL